MIAWLLQLALCVFTMRDVRVTADGRTVSDGDSVESFVTLCAHVAGHPETLTCRQVEVPRV